MNLDDYLRYQFVLLRNEGYALAAFSPDELRGVDASEVGAQMLRAGLESIADLAKTPGAQEHMLTPAQLMEKYPRTHPIHTRGQWCLAETKLGYWQWVRQQLDAAPNATTTFIPPC